jgi:uncharacterized protein (TIGR00369 family)
MATILDLAQAMLRGDTTPGVARLIGFVLKSIEPGRAVVELKADKRHHNPLGTLHGGIYCDVADAAMGLAYGATLGESESFTTIELKINFLRAGRPAEQRRLRHHVGEASADYRIRPVSRRAICRSHVGRASGGRLAEPGVACGLSRVRRTAPVSRKHWGCLASMPSPLWSWAASASAWRH